MVDARSEWTRRDFVRTASLGLGMGVTAASGQAGGAPQGQAPGASLGLFLFGAGCISAGGAFAWRFMLFWDYDLETFRGRGAFAFGPQKRV